MLTAVAGLLTFASVAVLPAFAQDTGGQSYKPMPRQEYSRYGGNHERQHDWGSGSYGYRNNDHGRYGSGYGYGKDQQDQNDWRGKGRYGSGYGYGKDQQDQNDWRGKGGYGHEQSKGYGGYGYRNS